jgi:hypothetical protein
VELFINAGSQFIERETDRKIKQQTHTDIKHGRKSNLILFRQWPVTAVTSLHVDSEASYGSDTLVDPSEYRIGDEGNSLVLLNRSFPNGYNNIKVVYTAGYDPVPSDLQNACLWLVTWYYTTRENKDIGRPRKSKGDESFDISQSAPKDIWDCIMSYKRTEMPGSDALVFNT